MKRLLIPLFSTAVLVFPALAMAQDYQAAVKTSVQDYAAKEVAARFKAQDVLGKQRPYKEIFADN